MKAKPSLGMTVAQSPCPAGIDSRKRIITQGHSPYPDPDPDPDPGIDPQSGLSLAEKRSCIPYPSQNRPQTRRHQFCQKIILPVFARTCMQLHATTYNQNLAPKNMCDVIPSALLLSARL
jgi:hypothetical protein